MLNKTVDLVVTEKSRKMADRAVYTFKTKDLSMTKEDIKKYLKKILNVDVAKVRTVTKPGSRKSDWRKRKPYQSSPVKKFYVTLKDDQTLDIAKFK